MEDGDQISESDYQKEWGWCSRERKANIAKPVIYGIAAAVIVSGIYFGIVKPALDRNQESGIEQKLKRK